MQQTSLGIKTPFLPSHTSNHIPSRKNPPPLIHPSINQAPHPTYSNTLRTRTIKQTNPQTPQKPLLVSDKSRTSDYPLLYIAPPPQKTIHPSIHIRKREGCFTYPIVIVVVVIHLAMDRNWILAMTRVAGSGDPTIRSCG